jgi:glycosyltransferase involved in cell wall biosynthesis
MINKLKVSILIPTFNQAKYIEQTILSALKQNYKNLEVILSDDCSTDNTEIVVKELLTKYANLIYFKNKQNIGRVNNYHKALYEYASGDLVLMLDGDDYLTDVEYVSQAVKLFEKNDKIVLVFAPIKTLIEHNGIIIKDKLKTDYQQIISGNLLFLDFFKGLHIPHQSSLYMRKYAMQIGYYQENIQSSDWESVLRLILNKRVGFINKFVGVWRKHDSNASKEINIEGIINNTKFIENAYNRAVLLKITDRRTLAIWREEMLVRMFLNFLIKTHYLVPVQVRLLKNRIKQYDIAIYFKIKYNLKYLVFQIIYKRKKLVHFLFKHLLKKESFISDLY